MPPSKKQVGCCTLCGKEVFEVRSRWPSDHPLAGEVRKIGRPLPTACRAVLVLMSGGLTSVTICNRCRPTPDRLPELWGICTRANALEVDEEHRKRIRVREITPEQREALVESVRTMVVDLPIAVLSIQRWEEADEFAARTR